MDNNKHQGLVNKFFKYKPLRTGYYCIAAHVISYASSMIISEFFPFKENPMVEQSLFTEYAWLYIPLFLDAVFICTLMLFGFRDMKRKEIAASCAVAMILSIIGFILGDLLIIYFSAPTYIMVICNSLNGVSMDIYFLLTFAYGLNINRYLIAINIMALLLLLSRSRKNDNQNEQTMISQTEERK